MHERDTLRRMDTRTLLRALGIPLWQAPRIVGNMRRRIQSAASSITLIFGIEHEIETLAQANITLAVVSSKAEDNVRRIIGAQMSGWFAAFDCGIDLFGKAARLRRLGRRFDVQPHDLVLIGDEMRDIEAARQAGMRVGVTAWGYGSMEMLADYRPDFIFQEAADISRLLWANCE